MIHLSANAFSNNNKNNFMVQRHFTNAINMTFINVNGGCYTGETIRHLSTRINEHPTGRPMPTEMTTHIHEPQRKDFTIALRTVHTKIGEAIVIKEIDADKRINANRPCFQPKLF